MCVFIYYDVCDVWGALELEERYLWFVDMYHMFLCFFYHYQWAFGKPVWRSHMFCLPRSFGHVDGRNLATDHHRQLLERDTLVGQSVKSVIPKTTSPSSGRQCENTSAAILWVMFSHVFTRNRKHRKLKDRDFHRSQNQPPPKRPRNPCWARLPCVTQRPHHWPSLDRRGPSSVPHSLAVCWGAAGEEMPKGFSFEQIEQTIGGGFGYIYIYLYYILYIMYIVYII